MNGRRGQALLMFAFALTAICGFLALAVDVGLAYSIRKSAQSAADAAALAGAQQALSAVGTGVYTSCPPGVVCQASPVPCASSPPNPPQTNIDSACLFALTNGFSTGSNNGYTQAVSVAANFNPPGSSPSYAPGLMTTNYWVDVEISEQIPHLFGGVINSSYLSIRVRSVAAIVQSGVPPLQKSTISLVQ